MFGARARPEPGQLSPDRLSNPKARQEPRHPKEREPYESADFNPIQRQSQAVDD